MYFRLLRILTMYLKEEKKTYQRIQTHTHAKRNHWIIWKPCDANSSPHVCVVNAQQRDEKHNVNARVAQSNRPKQPKDVEFCDDTKAHAIFAVIEERANERARVRKIARDNRMKW